MKQDSARKGDRFLFVTEVGETRPGTGEKRAGEFGSNNTTSRTVEVRWEGGEKKRVVQRVPKGEGEKFDEDLVTRIKRRTKKGLFFTCGRYELVITNKAWKGGRKLGKKK